MSNLIDHDIYETGEPFCNITIKLYDQIRKQRSKYINIIDIIKNFGKLILDIYFIYLLYIYFKNFQTKSLIKLIMIYIIIIAFK